MIAIEELLKTTNDANPIKKSYLRRTRYYNDFRVLLLINYSLYYQKVM